MLWPEGMVKGNKFKQGFQSDKRLGNAPSGAGGGHASAVCSTVLPREATGLAAGSSGRGMPPSGTHGHRATQGLPRVQEKHAEAEQQPVVKKKSKNKFKTAQGDASLSLAVNSGAQSKHKSALARKTPPDGVNGVKMPCILSVQPRTRGYSADAATTQTPRVDRKKDGLREGETGPGFEPGTSGLEGARQSKAVSRNNCLEPGRAAQSQGDGADLPRKKSRKNKFKQTGLEPRTQPPANGRGDSGKLLSGNGLDRHKAASPRSNAVQPGPPQRETAAGEPDDLAERRGMGKRSKRRQLDAAHAEGDVVQGTGHSKRQRTDTPGVVRTGGADTARFEAGSGAAAGKGLRATGRGPATFFTTRTEVPSAGAGAGAGLHGD